jgi:hypothetical protein
LSWVTEIGSTGRLAAGVHVSTTLNGTERADSGLRYLTGTFTQDFVLGYHGAARQAGGQSQK